MEEFKPLTPDLEHWFNSRLEEIPDQLRIRAEKAFSLFSWNELAPDQRKAVANQYDYRNDPATESHREFWFHIYAKLHDIQREIKEWSRIAPSVASDLAIYTSRLESLKSAEAGLKETIKKLERRQFPRYKWHYGIGSLPAESLSQSFSFINAARTLAEKLGCSNEEFAAWVFFGPNAGGLRAYYDEDMFRPFYFEPEMDCEYVAQLYSCVFDEQEVLEFSPEDRFITGAELLELLASELGDSVNLFVKSKINDGSLVDIHPIKGATKVGESDLSGLPSVETGLFSVAQIQKMLSRTGLMCALPPRIVDSGKRNESASARKERLHQWYDEEVRKEGARGALKRTAAREKITHQTLKKILDREK